MGAANFYNEKFFMDQNVVLVSINYRLGVLGEFRGKEKFQYVIS
jgi:Carboxylesterase type B